jgi:hypothetical protein
MSCYIGLYVKTCDLCMWTKLQHHKPHGELYPTETPEEWWDTITVDFVVELPNAHGYDAIMNVVASVGKRAHFMPTHTMVNVEGAVWLYLKEVWKLHGLPRSVRSDRGPQFIADFMRELYRLLGIKLAMSMAYHPQTDGQTERVNQEMEQFLCLFVNEGQDDWDELLPLGEFAYNNHVHSSTQQTLFMVDTGQHPHMGFEPQQPWSHMESVNKFKDCMARGLKEAKAALTKVKDEYALYYNCRRIPTPKLKPGNLVWINGSDIQATRPSRKLGHHNLGPYPVERCIGHGAYRIKLPPSLQRLHLVFPIVKLLPVEDDPIPGRQAKPPPPPVLVEGNEEFEVEKILNGCIRWRHLEYLVKWKGYDSGHNSWATHYNVHALDVITDFYRLNPGAPCQVNAATFDSISFS